mmetsp:Transcript_69797/g.195114  ORF Transcript_69797/g.195114 Transcript_69797/m.195114 type:complete len:105 (+) Transcript_69797:289-603(+)
MSGQLYVAPGATYNDVAAALQAAYTKKTAGQFDALSNMQSQGPMGMNVQMNMQTQQSYSISSIEYKGGDVDKEAVAVAGNHEAKIMMHMQMDMGPPKGQCCLVC